MQSTFGKDLHGEPWQKSEVSFGNMALRQDSPYADAVNAFFDRLENIMPRYVPIMPSIRKARSLALVLLVIVSIFVAFDGISNKDSLIPTEKYRWILMLCISLVVIMIVYNVKQKREYSFDLMKYNEQHITLLHFIPQYVQAFRSSVIQ